MKSKEEYGRRMTGHQECQVYSGNLVLMRVPKKAKGLEAVVEGPYWLLGWEDASGKVGILKDHQGRTGTRAQSQLYPYQAFCNLPSLSRTMDDDPEWLPQTLSFPRMQPYEGSHEALPDPPSKDGESGL